MGMGWEILIILVIALLVIGPEKMPELAGGLAKMIRQVRRMIQELRQSIDINRWDLPAEESYPQPSAAAKKAEVRTPEGGSDGASYPSGSMTDEDHSVGLSEVLDPYAGEKSTEAILIAWPVPGATWPFPGMRHVVPSRSFFGVGSPISPPPEWVAWLVACSVPGVTLSLLTNQSGSDGCCPGDRGHPAASPDLVQEESVGDVTGNKHD